LIFVALRSVWVFSVVVDIEMKFQVEVWKINFLIRSFMLVFLIMKASSVEITCDFGYPYEWEKIGNIYTCTVMNLSVSAPNEKVTKILGIHIDGKNDVDVKKLNIDNQHCEYIPQGFQMFFPNLEGLRVVKSHLVSLTSFDLRPFPNLRSCDMFYNQLVTLDSDLFVNNQELEYLYFGDNQLKKIGYNILRPLKKLSKAIFQHNVCIHLNAENRGEVDALQTKINRVCNNVAQLEAILEELERQDQEDRKQRRINRRKDETIKLIISTFVVLVVLGIISLIFYSSRNRLTRRTDDEEGFLQSFNELIESNAPVENGIYADDATNLSLRLTEKNSPK